MKIYLVIPSEPFDNPSTTLRSAQDEAQDRPCERGISSGAALEYDVGSVETPRNPVAQSDNYRLMSSRARQARTHSVRPEAR